MVRVINQETFDNIVKENVDDFGMAIEEAIEDAIKQLEAQVCLIPNYKKISLTECVIKFY